jgi:hypothetical protein
VRSCGLIAGLLAALCSCGRFGFDDLTVDGGRENGDDADRDSQIGDSPPMAEGWTELASPTGSNLYAVRAFAANNIWVAGDNGETLQFDGTQWITRSGPTTDVYMLWGTATDLWEVGAFCEAQRWNGSMWTVATVPNCGSASLNAIAGAAANDFWFAGVSGTIIHYLNGTFSLNSEAANIDLVNIWPVSTSDVYIVGTRGLIWHWSNGTILDERVPLSITIRSMWGANGNDLWTVGDGGTMYRKQNGGLWVKQPSVVTTTLNWLWGTSATDIWAIGVGGVAIHYDGASWTNVTMPTAITLRAMAAVPGGGLRIVGDNGVVLAHP